MTKQFSKPFILMIFILIAFSCLSFFTACGTVYSVKFMDKSYGPNYNTYQEVLVITINSGECIGNLAPTPIKNYFAGWYTEKECVNRWDLYKDEVKSNITLYAKYIINT